MWSAKKSLAFSKICTVFFMALLAGGAICAAWIVRELVKSSVSAAAAGLTPFLITIYLGCIPAAILLICLYFLLRRIGAGDVFIAGNVKTLRYISWCCFAGGAICAASALYYVPWIAVGVAAAFMGLIVRVVKNVVAKAVSLQDDVDLTI